MKKQIILLLSIALLVAGLMGCGGKPIQSVTNTGIADNSTESMGEAPGISPQSTEADAAFPRKYTDTRGKEVIIERKPERIAVTTWMMTESLMALDVPPVASDSVAAMSEWSSMKEYFAKYHVESLGESQEQINMEKLLEVQPDLILATSANEKIFEQLERIAPVIVLDVNLMFGDWQNSLREVAKIVAKEEVAEAIIGDLTTQIAQARETFAGSEKTVGFLRLWSKTLFSMGVDACTAYYDEETGLGLAIPKGWPDSIGQISLESLSESNPDYLFISFGEDPNYMDELNQNSVWNSLKAVKEGHVYPIDLSGLSGGPLAVKYGIQVIIDAGIIPN